MLSRPMPPPTTDKAPPSKTDEAELPPMPSRAPPLPPKSDEVDMDKMVERIVLADSCEILIIQAVAGARDVRLRLRQF